MGSFLSLFYLILWINVVSKLAAQQTEAASASVFDHVVGRYAFESYSKHNKTGFLYEVHLPVNLSGLGADIVRFRCGSLRRYGAQVKEFSLAMGVTVQPCVERVLIVRQYLGEQWSPIYYDAHNLSGYQLISHVLGLSAYDGRSTSSSQLSEVGLQAGKTPIKIDFSNVAKMNTSTTLGIKFLCASFTSDGRISISPQVSPDICVTTKNGHFGLVIESPYTSEVASTGRASKWKIIIGSTLGGALGASLLVLLFRALCVKVKKKSERVEMERRTYEAEALQISMVGHVRAPTASGTRTIPRLEHDYIPPI